MREEPSKVGVFRYLSPDLRRRSGRVPSRWKEEEVPETGTDGASDPVRSDCTSDRNTSDVAWNGPRFSRLRTHPESPDPGVNTILVSDKLGRLGRRRVNILLLSPVTMYCLVNPRDLFYVRGLWVGPETGSIREGRKEKVGAGGSLVGSPRLRTRFPYPQKGRSRGPSRVPGRVSLRFSFLRGSRKHRRGSRKHRRGGREPLHGTSGSLCLSRGRRKVVVGFCGTL